MAATALDTSSAITSSLRRSPLRRVSRWQRSRSIGERDFRAYLDMQQTPAHRLCYICCAGALFLRAFFADGDRHQTGGRRNIAASGVGSLSRLTATYARWPPFTSAIPPAAQRCRHHSIVTIGRFASHAIAYLLDIAYIRRRGARWRRRLGGAGMVRVGLISFPLAYRIKRTSISGACSV